MPVYALVVGKTGRKVMEAAADATGAVIHAPIKAAII
jgi:hypothetical protein